RSGSGRFPGVVGGGGGQEIAARSHVGPRNRIRRRAGFPDLDVAVIELHLLHSPIWIGGRGRQGNRRWAGNILILGWREQAHNGRAVASWRGQGGRLQG